ncbi:MAG TPA: hypothetical protein VGR35_23705 [Tepidisphaeraceae bacterium]|nr:hypothetical protein [Tepidisphaeraceae bacterium]
MQRLALAGNHFYSRHIDYTGLAVASEKRVPAFVNGLQHHQILTQEKLATLLWDNAVLLVDTVRNQILMSPLPGHDAVTPIPSLFEDRELGEGRLRLRSGSQWLSTLISLMLNRERKPRQQFSTVFASDDGHTSGEAFRQRVREIRKRLGPSGGQFLDPARPGPESPGSGRLKYGPVYIVIEDPRLLRALEEQRARNRWDAPQ